jgi:hypothetical protein
MAKGDIQIPVVSKFDDRGIKQAQTKMQKFGGALKQIGKVAGLAVLAVGAIGIRFAAGSLEAAEAAQVADKRLAKINESMGLFGASTGKVTERLKKFADQTMLQTGIDDEVIKATQAKLLTFKELAKTADITGGAFDRATKAALDLAAAGFGSAESNATQLGKALQDPVKGLASLGKAGVTFTADQKKMIKAMVETSDASAAVAVGLFETEREYNDFVKAQLKANVSGKEMDRMLRSQLTPAQADLYDQLRSTSDMLGAQDLVLSAIETQVGGTAEATATASQKMKVALGEIEEQLGMALLPLFEDFADWFIDYAPSIQGFFEDLGKWIDEDVAPVFNAFLGGITDFITDPLTVSVFEDLGAAMQTLATESIRFAESDLGKLLNQLIGGAFLVGLASLATGLERIGTALSVISDASDALTGNMSDRGLFKWFTNLKTVMSSFAGAPLQLLNSLINLILTLGIGEKQVRNAPGRLDYQGPKMTPFAEGGIVTRPVNALIGEAGPEAIIPLNKAGMMGNQYNITVNAGMGTDGAKLGRDIVEAIRKYEKTSGRVFAKA